MSARINQATIISDAQARQIACDWHGGGGSPLYALCSTGAIDTARADHDVAAEIRREIAWAQENGYGLRTIGLDALLFYVDEHGKRGPVDGWGRMPW